MYEILSMTTFNEDRLLLQVIEGVDLHSCWPTPGV